MPDDDTFQNWALALLTSGVIGNAIDRVHKQSVTDFLHVYSDNPKIQPILIDVIGSTAWPSFNIADAAIVIGMIMFGVFYIFLEKDQEDENEQIESVETVDV
jgi:signal peptidase II